MLVGRVLVAVRDCRGCHDSVHVQSIRFAANLKLLCARINPSKIQNGIRHWARDSLSRIVEELMMMIQMMMIQMVMMMVMQKNK